MMKKMVDLIKKGAPKIIPNNTGIKYSKLLLDLIKPYQQDTADLDEMELWAWDMDENHWPKNRTYKMFTEWFEVTMHGVLYDLENYPVDKV